MRFTINILICLFALNSFAQNLPEQNQSDILFLKDYILYLESKINDLESRLSNESTMRYENTVRINKVNDSLSKMRFGLHLQGKALNDIYLKELPKRDKELTYLKLLANKKTDVLKNRTEND